MKCTGCGCTETNACPGGCWWVKPGLCSTCWEAQCQHLAAAAVEFARATDNERHKRSLCGRECSIEVSPDFLLVRDHLSLPIFRVDARGISLMPHYDAAELMPLFEGAA